MNCAGTKLLYAYILAYIDQQGRTGSRVCLATVRPDSTGVWKAVVMSEVITIIISVTIVKHYNYIEISI